MKITFIRLQQLLPFTVLKLFISIKIVRDYNTLQQLLPFTVLKLCFQLPMFLNLNKVATALTVYGIETVAEFERSIEAVCCNSSYRLRYWNLLDMLVQQKQLL